MALQKRKISQLPPAGPITGSELVEVVQGGQNRRALASQFSGGGGGGPVAWGGIIGNIDTQSDLIARFSQYTMNTDPRLSDAREWTAETVTQAEAEAGISSTRRAWSAHRVRQSIEFFWESATTPFGRVLAQTPSASTARGSLELGDSATRNVGTTAGTVAAGDDPRFGGGGGAVSWGSILGDIEDQTDLTSALASKVDDGDPRLSDARTPTAHTHPISDVIGLQGELDGKEFTLTAGANITIDRTNPAAPVISSSGGGGGGGADWGQIGGILANQTDLQNALNAKANDNDPRLSDEREWSAETVTQAEAEAGTATTRRAWTAQRVRQAIGSWWAGTSDKTKLDNIEAGAQVNTITSVAGRTGSVTLVADDISDATTPGKALLTAADEAAQRTSLGLGSAATRTALGTTGDLYSRDSILGTVSQSGGVPTGAIIERGSNENGEYVRYADGTQICLSPLLNAGPLDQEWADWYRTANVAWTFPASFAAIPSVSCMSQTGSFNILAGASGLTSITNTGFFAARPTLGTINMILFGSAIGRWY